MKMKYINTEIQSHMNHQNTTEMEKYVN